MTWHIYILSTLIAGLILFAGHRYVAYRTASAKFRDIVLRELGDFYPTFTRWNGAMFERELQDRFPILQAAVTDFSAALPWYQKDTFGKAWSAYCNCTGRECDMNTYLHYFDSYDPAESTQEEATLKAQNLFHDNVKHLLSFASET